MIGNGSGDNTAAIYLGLFIFGLGYNAFVAYAESRTWLKGHLYVAVAAGVAGTLFGVWLIDKDAAILALGAFVASGLPMATGAMYRYAREREEQLEDHRREMRERHKDDTTQEVASRR